MAAYHFPMNNTIKIITAIGLMLVCLLLTVSAVYCATHNYPGPCVFSGVLLMAALFVVILFQESPQ